MNIFKDKRILITGGAGFIGSNLAKQILEYEPKIIRILDNSEYGLYKTRQKLNDEKHIRYLIGDVRDKERLGKAVKDIDIVYHCSALKHVDFCEFNPYDAIQTNVIGTKNIIDASTEEEVDKFILISTDKAPNPNSVMGATKLLGERLVISSFYYKGMSKTILSSVRFGNVIGSTGSVVPTFMEQIKNGSSVTITNDKMTRFMMSVDDATNLILKATELAIGREIFILKMPSMRIKDLAEVMIEKYSNKSIDIDIIGSRLGEKIHEELMTKYEAENAYENSDLIVITGDSEYYTNNGYRKIEPISYTSDKSIIMTKSEISKLLDKIND